MLIRSTTGNSAGLLYGRTQSRAAIFGPLSALTGALDWMTVYRLASLRRSDPDSIEGHAFVIALDGQGRLVHNLQDPESRRLSNIRGVISNRGHLYFGSFNGDAVGRLPAPEAAGVGAGGVGR